MTAKSENRKILTIIFLGLLVALCLISLGALFTFLILSNINKTNEIDISQPTEFWTVVITVPATYSPIGTSAPVRAEPQFTTTVHPLEGRIIFRIYNIKSRFIDYYERELYGNSESMIELLEKEVELSYEFTGGGITQSLSESRFINEGDSRDEIIVADRGSWLYLSVYNSASVGCEIITIRAGEEVILDAALSKGSFATCSGIAPTQD